MYGHKGATSFANRAVSVLILASLLVPAPLAAAKELGLSAPAAPQVFAAPHANTKPVGGPPTGAVSNHKVREIVSLRSRTSRTYLTERGQYEADVYAGPINYKDGGGTWQPIDNSLVPSAAVGYAHQNKGNDYTLQLPDRIEKGARALQ
jgi:hypothetical protein